MKGVSCWSFARNSCWVAFIYVTYCTQCKIFAWISICLQSCCITVFIWCRLHVHRISCMSAPKPCMWWNGRCWMRQCFTGQWQTHFMWRDMHSIDLLKDLGLSNLYTKIRYIKITILLCKHQIIVITFMVKIFWMLWAEWCFSTPWHSFKYKGYCYRCILKTMVLFWFDDSLL